MPAPIRQFQAIILLPSILLTSLETLGSIP